MSDPNQNQSEIVSNVLRGLPNKQIFDAVDHAANGLKSLVSAPLERLFNFFNSQVSTGVVKNGVQVRKDQANINAREITGGLLTAAQNLYQETASSINFVTEAKTDLAKSIIKRSY